MIERVVFDTSTLIGAALKIGSKPHQALLLALDSYMLCGSEQMIAELAEVLNRGHFDRYLTQSDRDRFFAMVRDKVEMFSVNDSVAESQSPPCRDLSDTFILALALAAHADAIVSSDQDLLVLHPWHGISILTPAQFLAEFGA